MTNLNKESFWNPMRELYPDAVARFCEWIDEYKQIAGWSSLFGPRVKFDDIPYEMQMGIMNRFFIEHFSSKEEYANPEMAMEYHQEMADALASLQKKIASKN